MKKSIILLLSLLAVCAGQAWSSPVDPGDNSLGFYFDQDATVYCVNAVGFVQGYLILTRPTFDAIKGLECYLGWDESVCSYYGMILPPTALNIGDHHNVILGLGSPLATTIATVMATYNLGPAAAPISFSLGAANPPSIPGFYPVVVDGDDNMFQIGMVTILGGDCAGINGGAGCYAVDTQTETWSHIKSLYR